MSKKQQQQQQVTTPPETPAVEEQKSLLPGLTFMSMAHRDDEPPAKDDLSPPDANAKTDPPPAQSSDDGLDSDNAADPGAESEPPPYFQDLRSHIAALEVQQSEELSRQEEWRQQMLREQQQRQIAQQKPTPQEDGDPDEYLTRKDMQRYRDTVQADFYNHLGVLYKGLLNGEKQRFFSDVQAVRQQDPAAFDKAIPPAEINAAWRDYESNPIAAGFGKNWRQGFQDLYQQRNAPMKDERIKQLEREIAELKKGSTRREDEDRANRGAIMSPASAPPNFQRDELKPGQVRPYKAHRKSVFSNIMGRTG